MNDNRRNPSGELFYICNLKYPYLSTDFSLLLWYRLIGLRNQTGTRNQPMVPLLLSDPIALLLQILLSLPFEITQGRVMILFSHLFFSLRTLSSDCTSVVQFNFHAISIRYRYGNE